MRLILGSHAAVGLADAATGTVIARRDLVQPTFVAAAPAGERLYAVSEDPDGPGRLYVLGLTATGLGEVSAAAATGDLGPCHVSVHPSGTAVLVSHYVGGSLGLLRLDAAGEPVGPPRLAHHDGSGPDTDRQDGPHVHQAVTDPGGRWVLVCDLGADAVTVYRLAGGGPVRHSAAAFLPGQGVRHLAFAPDGRRAYAAAELSSQLVACDWDAATGTLSPGKSIHTTGPTEHRNYPGAVLVSRDGRRVYVTNRGSDSIGVVDTASFTRLTTVPTGGAWPRDACLSPDGDRLFVANERAGTVTGFDLDADGVPVPGGPVIGFDGVTSVLAVR